MLGSWFHTDILEKKNVFNERNFSDKKKQDKSARKEVEFHLHLIGYFFDLLNLIDAILFYNSIYVYSCIYNFLEEESVRSCVEKGRQARKERRKSGSALTKTLHRSYGGSQVGRQKRAGGDGYDARAHSAGSFEWKDEGFNLIGDHVVS